jgi:hypothetical protein
MTEPISSKTIVNHPASPEELDELMQVTSPRGWIALVGCAMLLVAAFVWSLLGTVTDTVDAQGVLFRENGLTPVPAPCDGVIESFLAQTGVPLEEGTPLLRVRPPDGQQPQTVKCPFCCQILSRGTREGTPVKKGAPLLLLENLKKPLLARLYVPVNVGYTVTRDMPVQIAPANVNPSEFGYLQGTIESAARFPITQQELIERLQNEDLARGLATGGPKLQILVKLDPVPKSTGADSKSTSAVGNATGTEGTATVTDCKVTDTYKWSASAGPPLALYSGTPCQGRIIVAQHSPIHLVFPSLGK